MTQGELAPIPVPVSVFNYWTIDLITRLTLDAGCNAIYIYVDKLKKLVKIIPCVVGDGGLLDPNTAKMFFDHII